MTKKEIVEIEKQFPMEATYIGDRQMVGGFWNPLFVVPGKSYHLELDRVERDERGWIWVVIYLDDGPMVREAFTNNYIRVKPAGKRVPYSSMDALYSVWERES
jgi:hypothetical protein